MGWFCNRGGQAKSGPGRIIACAILESVLTPPAKRPLAMNTAAAHRRITAVVAHVAAAGHEANVCASDAKLLTAEQLLRFVVDGFVALAPAELPAGFADAFYHEAKRISDPLIAEGDAPNQPLLGPAGRAADSGHVGHCGWCAPQAGNAS